MIFLIKKLFQSIILYVQMQELRIQPKNSS